MFPDITASDNSIGSLELGIASAQEGEICFDALEIGQKLTGAEAYAAQARLMRELRAAHPTVTQLQGSEISLIPPHLNEFTVDTELTDYEAFITDNPLPGTTPSEKHKILSELKVEGFLGCALAGIIV